MESLQFKRSGRSESDQPQQRRLIATKLTGYGHDTLSKAKQLVSDSDTSEKGNKWHQLSESDSSLVRQKRASKVKKTCKV